MKNEDVVIRLELLEDECVYGRPKGISPFADHCGFELKKCCKKYKKGKRCKKCPKR